MQHTNTNTTMLRTKANQLIEIVNDSVTTKCSNSNSNYHNVKHAILVTRTIWIVGQRERWFTLTLAGIGLNC